MSFIQEIKSKAKKDIKTIVFPEANDIRTLEATEIVLNEGYANIILIGNEEEIMKLAKSKNLNLTNAKIINPKTSADYEEYATKLYELRKEKGLTEEKARELVLDPVYFGMMMIKLEKADGLVSGAAHSTADTLRPALQILKTAPGTKLVSAFFIMCVPNSEYGENGTFVFADSGLNANPSADELSEIAISSSKSCNAFIFNLW